MLNIDTAEHEEIRPQGSTLFINKLSCSLAGQKQTIQIAPDTLTHQAYETKTTVEQFQCNYGLNETHRNEIGTGGLGIAGVDDDGNVRIVEMAHHPFFVATLYLPQLRSKPPLPHPLITAFIKAVSTLQTLKSANRETVKRSNQSV